MLERHDSLVPRLKTEMLIIYILVMALPLSVVLASVEISFEHLVNNLLPCQAPAAFLRTRMRSS